MDIPIVIPANAGMTSEMSVDRSGNMQNLRLHLGKAVLSPVDCSPDLLYVHRLEINEEDSPLDGTNGRPAYSPMTGAAESFRGRGLDPLSPKETCLSWFLR
jgi:hypothetical protein